MKSVWAWESGPPLTNWEPMVKSPGVSEAQFSHQKKETGIIALNHRNQKKNPLDITKQNMLLKIMIIDIIQLWGNVK